MESRFIHFVHWFLEAKSKFGIGILTERRIKRFLRPFPTKQQPPFAKHKKRYSPAMRAVFLRVIIPMGIPLISCPWEFIIGSTEKKVFNFVRNASKNLPIIENNGVFPVQLFVLNIKGFLTIVAQNAGHQSIFIGTN